MTFDQNKLRAELHNKFYSSDLKVSDVFEQQFTADIIETLNIINDGYTFDDMPILLLGHVKLLQAHHKLKSHFISLYCNSLSEAALQEQMYNAAHNALIGIGNISPTIENLVKPFFARNKGAWVQLFRDILTKGNIEIEEELEKLSLYIAHEFANNIVFKLEYNIYNKFFILLQEQFKYLNEYIEVETNIDSFKKCILNFTPAKYRNKPIIEYGFTRTEGPEHPENVIFELSNKFFLFCQRQINQAAVYGLLAGLINRLSLHQERLGILSADSNSLLVMGAVRQTFQLYAKAYVTLKSTAAHAGGNLFNSWLDHHGYAAIGELLLAYKNQLFLRRASKQVHTALMAQVETYLQLPDFLQERNRNVASSNLNLG